MHTALASQLHDHVHAHKPCSATVVPSEVGRIETTLVGKALVLGLGVADTLVGNALVLVLGEAETLVGEEGATDVLEG